MLKFFNNLFRISLFCILSLIVRESAAEPLRIATGDNPSVEFVNLMAAADAVKERGIEVEVSFLNSEEMATEAILLDLADLAVGTPHQFIQSSGADVRMVVQLSRLRFHPMVNTERYTSWSDLEGAEVYVHGQGSGTEAIMNYFARKNGVTYSKVHYLPGSNVRANAMLQGRVFASIVDTPRMKLLLESGEGKFARLPVGKFNVTDEALFGNLATIQKKQKEIAIFLEEVVKAWRMVNRDAASITANGRAESAISALAEEDQGKVVSYYQTAVSSNAFPNDGGLDSDLGKDLEFFSESGGLSGNADTLKLDEFWYLAPLKQALSQVRN